MVTALLIFGYLFMGGITGTLAAFLHDQLSPNSDDDTAITVCAGIFWIFLVPIALGVLLSVFVINSIMNSKEQAEEQTEESAEEKHVGGWSD